MKMKKKHDRDNMRPQRHNARIATNVSNPRGIRRSIGDGTNFTELGSFAAEPTGCWSNDPSIALSGIDLRAATDQPIRVGMLLK